MYTFLGESKMRFLFYFLKIFCYHLTAKQRCVNVYYFNPTRDVHIILLTVKILLPSKFVLATNRVMHVGLSSL